MEPLAKIACVEALLSLGILIGLLTILGLWVMLYHRGNSPKSISALGIGLSLLLTIQAGANALPKIQTFLGIKNKLEIVFHQEATFTPLRGTHGSYDTIVTVPHHREETNPQTGKLRRIATGVSSTQLSPKETEALIQSGAITPSKIHFILP